MNNIKLIFTLLVLTFLVASCNDDGGDSKLEWSDGAVAHILKDNAADSFIDLIAINEGGSINLAFSIDKKFGDVKSMDVVAFYTKTTGTVSKGTLFTNVTTFPSNFSIDQEDLYTAFTNLNTPSDFEVGDKLTITVDLTLSDGTVIKTISDNGVPNYGSNLATPPFSPVQVYNVACPSDLGGTYSVLTSGSSTDPGPDASVNPIANYPYTVTITDNGGGSYTISDAFGGVYILWYEMYGLDFEVEGSFSDVCGTISGSFPEPFGTDVTYTGSVDSDTGIITINWVNGFDDQGVSVFTKVE